jgi:hypothetical protein
VCPGRDCHRHGHGGGSPRRSREARVGRHLRALVPGDRPAQLVGQAWRLPFASLRVSLWRPRPPAQGVLTHATTSALPMSIPAHRSNTTSIADALIVSCSTGSAGPTDLRRCETCFQQQSVVPGRPLAQSQIRVRAHQAGTHSARPHTDSHPSWRPPAMHSQIRSTALSARLPMVPVRSSRSSPSPSCLSSSSWDASRTCGWSTAAPKTCATAWRSTASGGTTRSRVKMGQGVRRRAPSGHQDGP